MSKRLDRTWDVCYNNHTEILLQSLPRSRLSQAQNFGQKNLFFKFFAVSQLNTRGDLKCPPLPGLVTDIPVGHFFFVATLIFGLFATRGRIGDRNLSQGVCGQNTQKTEPSQRNFAGDRLRFCVFLLFSVEQCVKFCGAFSSKRASVLLVGVHLAVLGRGHVLLAAEALRKIAGRGEPQQRHDL